LRPYEELREPVRYLNLLSFLDVFRRLTGGCAFACAAVLLATPVVAQAPPSLVITPFENLSGNEDDAWIGAGIAESLAAGLSERFLVSAEPEAEGAATRFLVEGAYQRQGDEIRITAQLIERVDGSVVASAKVDGLRSDLFELQDAVVVALLVRPSMPKSVMPEQLTTALGSVAESERVSGNDPEFGEVEMAAFRMGDDVLRLIDGPPPPAAPATVTRDAQGRATVRAVRVDAPLELDGRLDEAVYSRVEAITDFIQQTPIEGAPATEKTEAWVLYDDTNVYVSARAWDRAPESEWVANEMRRDGRQIRQNDLFMVLFDTFYDRRNGVAFQVTPIGARSDFQVTNEGNPNLDWNPVWDVRTGRFDGGWVAEMAIPFKSLRYRPGDEQIWGVQLRRGIRRRAEMAYLTRLPISAAGAGAGAGTAGVFRVSQAGTLVGIQPPPAGRNLEIKPYAIGGVTRDRVGNPSSGNVSDGDFGLDVKYGITDALTADITYNTDFAQVEVDEQQVNLTRFSLFFPEKREFFLEGRGIFDFARGGFRAGGGGGFFGGGNAPTLFYSRRIGLQAGEVVPILGGGRVTGKVGMFDIGALSISTDDQLLGAAESTNFTVVRLKRDILRRSAIGGIFTNRSVAVDGAGSSQAYGLDATLAFFENIEAVGYYARTETPGVSGRDTSYQGRLLYAGDRYGMQVEHLLVEDDFNPEVGFLRRDNFRRTFAEGRFSPRPASIDWVRQFRLVGSIDYIQTADTEVLETRTNTLQLQTEFQNSDTFGVSLTDNYELLLNPFSPGGADFSIPLGGYAFADAQAVYRLGEQRPFSGGVSVQRGGFFGGDITAVGLQGGRLAVLPQLSIEPSVSINWIETPYGSLRTDLVVTRMNYAVSPWMFFSGLVQYNSANDTVSSNLRFRWEYSPGSEIFVVYTEDRDSATLRPNRFTELRNRGFVIKLNRLFRF